MYNNVWALVTFFLVYNVSIDWREGFCMQYIYSEDKAKCLHVCWQQTAFGDTFRNTPLWMFSSQYITKCSTTESDFTIVLLMLFFTAYHYILIMPYYIIWQLMICFHYICNELTHSSLTHCPFNLLVQICCNVRKWLLLVSERFDFMILHDGVGYDFY